jgi:nucleoside-diphosphate-sugar epimerase
MRVAVTGGNGLIGVPTVNALTGFGVSVLVASRHPGTGRDRAVVDILDSSTWKNLLYPEKPERMIHLAWDFLDNYEHPDHVRSLQPAHLSFLKWCCESGITDITVAGTCFEYGRKEGELYECMETEPVTRYGIAKDTLRKRLVESCGDALTLKWTRIFYIQNDKSGNKGIFRIIREAAESGAEAVPLTGGAQLRDYLPLTDIGKFLAHFCLQDSISGIVNCCSGNPVSIKDLISQYASRWPWLRLEFGKLPYREFEPMAFWGNTERMKKVFASQIVSVHENSTVITGCI